MSEHIALIVPKSERDMRFSEHRSDLGHMHRAGGHGLTTAAREDPLPWDRQGSRGKGGEASARLSNGWRVM